MASLVEELEKLEWIRISLLVRASERYSPSSHPICVMEAIIKAVSDQTWGIAKDQWKNRPVFHFKNLPHNFRVRPGEFYQAELMFTEKSLPEIEDSLRSLREYFSLEENCRSFSLVEISAAESRNLARLYDELGEIPKSGEICLWFLTPLHFKPVQGKSRYVIEKESFFRSLASRLSRLFSKNFSPSELIESELEILPYYWDYTEIKHSSHSQPGHIQYINGCIGPLYLRGNFTALKPWLYLSAELHAGSKMSASLGYFKLIKESWEYFDKKFPDLSQLKAIAAEVLERYDNALLDLVQPEKGNLKPEEAVNCLYQELKEGNYLPLPYRAFTIRTESGKERQVEQPEYKDLIAGLYALRLLSPVLDKAYEEESIGFRKGRSREKAIELIREAINEGYLWLVESDIENFFPAINLEKLDALLECYLPEKDVRFKSFLKSMIRAPFRQRDRVITRERGLAQGHPLSPCLTNLYLDSFDEQVKKLGARLIRYADDFLIFCKTREQAELILQEIEKILAGLELKLKKEKTAIKNVSEGFSFLGYSFSGTEAEVFRPPETRLLEKPLFITEPFVFVTVDGNAVSIKKDGQVIQTIPFRRLGEIMILDKAVVSTSLIKRCVQNKVPLTVALESGYFMTTLRPDSKEFFLVSARHYNKYARLSEAERTAIARDIVRVRIGGYMKVFKQKYSSEMKAVLKELREITERLGESTDLNEIRGYEGLASRVIYSNFNTLLGNPAFYLKKRERHPPDRINSLLNFASYLLYSRINALIRSEGLNPYLGFVHSPSDDYESLVADLVDIFRARVDRLIIKLINLRVIDENMFEQKEGAFYLNREAKHRFMSHFENELNLKSDVRKLSLKEQITLQVRIIKDWVLKDCSLVIIESL